jgi:hypothetical protein
VAGLAAWTALTCLTLLASPLSWQRYTLALLPEAALLAGIGAAAVLQAIRPRASSG